MPQADAGATGSTLSSSSEIPSARPQGVVTHASGIPEWGERGLDGCTVFFHSLLGEFRCAPEGGHAWEGPL